MGVAHSGSASAGDSGNSRSDAQRPTDRGQLPVLLPAAECRASVCGNRPGTARHSDPDARTEPDTAEEPMSDPTSDPNFSGIKQPAFDGLVGNHARAVGLL